MKKNAFDYFNSFIRYADEAVRAAECLSGALTDFDLSREQEAMDAMHHIEQEADGIKHETIDRLAKEFLPPIEREDIVSLCHEMDNVVDSIDDVLRKICLYQVKAMRPETAAFCDLLTRCCKGLQTLTAELPRFKKSTLLRQAVTEVNDLEAEGDELHFTTVQALFASGEDAITIFTWKSIYDTFEACYDACEHVADVIEGVVMKNS